MNTQITKVEICPKTGKEVVMQYDPGNTDNVHDWLCLHGDSEEEDAEAVRLYREQLKSNKI